MDKLLFLVDLKHTYLFLKENILEVSMPLDLEISRKGKKARFRVKAFKPFKA